MAMDPDSGQLREIMSAMEAKEKEVVFSVGEVVKIRGCYFEIDAITNGKMYLKSIPKEEGQIKELQQAPGMLRGQI